jgi:hypothetical protein
MSENSNNFKIDNDVPIPEPRGASKYPFRSMEVGDSFLAEDKRAGAAASFFARRNKEYRFACRSVPGGLRIWRIEVESKTNGKQK